MQLFTILAFFQEGEPAEAPFWFSMAPILFMVVVFYFLFMRPNMKREKEHQNLVADLKKGDKIITSGGIWGEVEEVDPQVIRLKVSDKTKIRVSRNSVTAMQPAPGENKDAK